MFGIVQQLDVFAEDSSVNDRLIVLIWFQFSDIFMEKHWKSVVHRSVCDYFLEAQRKSTSAHNISPVMSTPHHYLISIFRCGLYLVAVTHNEIPPLFVIEFLHRVVDNFIDYFNDCNESLIKEHYVVVYELLDEMLDNGFPLATEANILKELIKPPNILRTIANTVTGRTKYGLSRPVSYQLLPDSSTVYLDEKVTRQ